jgi:SynChlorMet cassette protein ScmD
VLRRAKQCLREELSNAAVSNHDKPIASPLVLLREEFDDWAVLFDPDTGHGFGANPTGVYLWKVLDGEHSIDDLLKALRRDALDVPTEVADHLLAFVAELAQQGLAGHEGEQVCDDRGRIPPRPRCVGTTTFTYEHPRLINLNGEKPATGACCNSVTGATGDGCGCVGNCVNLSGGCYAGACADGYCGTGANAGFYCTTGSSAYTGCRDGCDGYPNGAACGGGSCVGYDKCTC